MQRYRVEEHSYTRELPGVTVGGSLRSTTSQTEGSRCQDKPLDPARLPASRPALGPGPPLAPAAPTQAPAQAPPPRPSCHDVKVGRKCEAAQRGLLPGRDGLLGPRRGLFGAGGCAARVHLEVMAPGARRPGVALARRRGPGPGSHGGSFGCCLLWCWLR